jgi:hypothetical protein
VRRSCVLALAACLLAPATATAKGGVIFDRYPDVQAVGSPMKFTAMLMRDGGTGPMQAIEGRRPLIAFRNATTGQVVRVRGSRSDLNGLSYGTVALPSKGPWETDVSVGGRSILPGDSQPFRVGVGLTQTIPAADSARPRSAEAPQRESFPWLWIAAAAAIGSALVIVGMRRRWGAA